MNALEIVGNKQGQPVQEVIQLLCNTHAGARRRLVSLQAQPEEPCFVGVHAWQGPHPRRRSPRNPVASADTSSVGSGTVTPPSPDTPPARTTPRGPGTGTPGASPVSRQFLRLHAGPSMQSSRDVGPLPPVPPLANPPFRMPLPPRQAGTQTAQLRTVFANFAAFGTRKPATSPAALPSPRGAAAPTLDVSRLVKLCRDAGLISNARGTTAVELAFSSAKRQVQQSERGEWSFCVCWWWCGGRVGNPWGGREGWGLRQTCNTPPSGTLLIRSFWRCDGLDEKSSHFAPPPSQGMHRIGFREFLQALDHIAKTKGVSGECGCVRAGGTVPAPLHVSATCGVAAGPCGRAIHASWPDPHLKPHTPCCRGGGPRRGCGLRWAVPQPDHHA